MAIFQIPVIKTSYVTVKAETLDEAITKVDTNKGNFNPRFPEGKDDWEIEAALKRAGDPSRRYE